MLFWVPLLALVWSAAPARANLVITPTFDSTITSLSNAAAVEAAINSQIAFYQNTFSNPINVGITFADMSTGLGESSFGLYGVSYSAFRAQLAADSSGDATDTTALAHLATGINNPVTNEPVMLMKSANLKALGATSLPANDGTISVNLSLTSIDGGPYSLASVVDHEIDEILGLGSTLGLGLSPAYLSDPSPEDLFRYDASGKRSFSTNASCIGAPAAYFSLDGTTRLAQFNNCGNGGDYGDWATSGTPQVQDAFGTPGSTEILTASSPEIVALDAIGYTLDPVPEPALFAPLALGFAALLGLRKK